MQTTGTQSDKGNLATGLFSDRESAERAYEDLSSRGYSSEDINVVMSDDTRVKYSVMHPGAKPSSETRPPRVPGSVARSGGPLSASPRPSPPPAQASRSQASASSSRAR